MKGTIYVGEQPIDVSRCSSLESEEVSDATHDFPRSYSFSVNIAMPKRFARHLKQETQRLRCVMKEASLVKKNPKHLYVIARCIHYGNRIPRKYRRLYKELIKSMLKGKKERI